MIMMVEVKVMEHYPISNADVEFWESLEDKPVRKINTKFIESLHPGDLATRVHMLSGAEFIVPNSEMPIIEGKL